MAKTYTAAGTVAAGDVATAAAWNVVTADVNNLIVPPMCRVYRGSTLSITNATDTFITFPSEDIDTDGMFTPTSDTITIQTAGVYLVTAGLIIASNATGVRAMNILKNPSSASDISKGIVSTYAQAVNGLATVLSCSTITECVATDVIKMGLYQTSGGALNVGDTNNTRASFLSVAWIGRTS